ncbi:hypothetical protein Scep_026101 [Stephania cephalantha]|uniref:Uncharacterized protein n=1 Tax=Stephania cephalantha TaxID=152367 RepID=A0AAP0HRS2_9MAGN
MAERIQRWAARRSASDGAEEPAMGTARGDANAKRERAARRRARKADDVAHWRRTAVGKQRRGREERGERERGGGGRSGGSRMSARKPCAALARRDKQQAAWWHVAGTIDPPNVFFNSTAPAELHHFVAFRLHCWYAISLHLQVQIVSTVVLKEVKEVNQSNRILLWFLWILFGDFDILGC